MNWQPIETAPKETREIFVVRGFRVNVRTAFPYTTDPYCVWRRGDGGYERWPHHFPPTHWMPLPPPPIVSASDAPNSENTP